MASISLITSAESGPHDGSVPTAPSVPPVTMKHFQELRRHLEHTRHCLWKFNELDGHIQALEEMIFALDTQSLVSEMFLSSLSPEMIALQQVAYCRWETELEHRFVESLGSSSATIDNYTLVQRFRRLIAREVDLLGTSPTKRLLFIGSGPVPISAILFQERIGARVDCIDADPMAVEQSRKLIARLGLSNHIHVHRTDGSAVDASQYDAVVIALLAKPKREILTQLAASTRPDCRIICRTSHGLRVLVYEPMDIERDLHHFQIADKRHTQWADTISSLSLTRVGL